MGLIFGVKRGVCDAERHGLRSHAERGNDSGVESGNDKWKINEALLKNEWIKRHEG